MTKEQYISLLKSPSTINLNLVGELEDLTTRFPYFQNAHLLLAKQYHGHENIRFEGSLRKAAAYVSDRSVLYRLIKSTNEEVIHIKNTDETEKSKVESNFESATITTADHIDFPLENVLSTEVERIEETDFTAVENESDKTIIDQSTPEKSSEPTVPELSNPREIIEQRLREIENNESDSHHNKTDLTLNGSHSKEETSERKQEIVRPVEPVNTEQKIKTPTPLQKPDTRSEKPSIKKEPVPVSQEAIKHSFTEWLRLKSVAVISADQPFNYFENILDSGVDHPSTQSSSKGVDGLLDNFIKNEPRIVPARSEFYSPGNMARKSAIEHGDLISETLARIYAQQGNLRKAIEAYQKLSLKNPEKSSYFAALIKDLEEKEEGS